MDKALYAVNSLCQWGPKSNAFICQSIQSILFSIRKFLCHICANFLFEKPTQGTIVSKQISLGVKHRKAQGASMLLFQTSLDFYAKQLLITHKLGIMKVGRQDPIG